MSDHTPPRAPQSWQYPRHAAGPPTDAFGRPLAAWWKRVVAYLIDGLLLLVPGAVIFGILGAGTAALDPAGTDGDAIESIFGASFLVAAGLSSLASLAYFALLEGSHRGQTVGKIALRIQVRDDETGGPIGYGRGLLRHLPQTLAGFTSCFGLVFLVLDAFWPLRDPMRQALHDKVARTLVVDLSRD